MANLDRQSPASILPIEEAIIRKPEHSVERQDLVDVLRNLPTNKSASGFTEQDYPYAKAEISVVRIDPKNPQIPLRFSQTFIVPNHHNNETLENVIGKPLQDVSDLTIIKDKSGQVVDQLFPILLEQVPDEAGNLVWMPADGNHRLFDNLNDPSSEPFTAVLISNIPKKYLPTYWPVGIEEVKVMPMPLEVENRRRLKPGFNIQNYKENRPAFTLLGSPESRNSDEEMVKGASLHVLIDRPVQTFKDTINNVKQKFNDQYAPLPPLTSMEAGESHPLIDNCLDIVPVTNTLGVGKFLVRHGSDGSVSELYLTVKSRDEYVKHATRATAIVSKIEAREINSLKGKTLDGEFQIEHPNELLEKYHVIGSSSPQAPKLVNFEIKLENIHNCPFSYLVLTLDNGQEVPVMVDRRDPQPIYSIRTLSGNLCFTTKYSLSQGVSLISTPTPSRLHQEYQDILKKYRQIDSELLHGPFHAQSTPIFIEEQLRNLTSWHGKFETPPAADNGHRYVEFISREVDNLIGSGQFYDLKTGAIAVVAQLRSGHMFPRKDIEKYYILMEKVFDPIHGKTLIVPRLPLKYQNKYQPRFPDPKNSLDVQYTNTVKPQLILDNIPNIVAVPADKVIDLMEKLKLDYETIGHLGTILRQNKLLVYSRPIEYEPPDLYWHRPNFYF